jgi:protein associated with RNAse G/E
MTTLPSWQVRDRVLLRGVYGKTPVYVQSLRVVKDTPEETVLFIAPGAECVAPRGYIRQGHGWCQLRWQETLDNTLHLEKYIWHTNRFLILLEPEKFYSTIYIWNATSGEFVCYYINFQLPFHRTPLGFDTLDLDLDLVVDPSFNWEWKDEMEYQNGIRSGGIRPEWVGEVERAKSEVLERIEKQIHPLDGSWLNFQPDPVWLLPHLPGNWDEVS